MRVIRKDIYNEVKKRFNIDVELVKTDGFYWWSGKATCFFNETCTYITKLNDYSIDRWLEDFTIKADDYLSSSDYSSLEEAIEAINWDICK